MKYVHLFLLHISSLFHSLFAIILKTKADFFTLFLKFKLEKQGRPYSRNFAQQLILARKDTFLRKGHQKFHPHPPLPIQSLL